MRHDSPSRSECGCPCRKAGVDGDYGTAGVARMTGRQECDRSSDLRGAGAAPERQRLEQMLPVFLATGAVFCLPLLPAAKPLPFDRPRVQRDDADAVPVADTAEGLSESCERRVARYATDVLRIMRVGGIADHVDDYACFARLHRRVEGAAHVDIAEDLQIPRLTPRLIADVEQRAGGGSTRIVHQDISVWVVFCALIDVFSFRKISRDRIDTHIRCLHHFALFRPDLL